MKRGAPGATLVFLMVSLTMLAAGPAARDSSDLVAAVKAGDAARVTSLIKEGANPNARDSIGMTPLHYAAYRGALAVETALLKGGADPNAKDSMGMTPLHAAAFEGHADFVKVLLENHADVSAKDHAGNTALHYAVFNKDVRTAQVLLAGGAKGSIANKRGATPAAMALASGKPALARLFPSRSPGKAPVVITNETLSSMPSDGHFVIQEGGGCYSPKPEKTTAKGVARHRKTRPSGKMTDLQVTDKVNADYDRVDTLLRKKRSLEEELPKLKKECEEFNRIQNGEQVGNTVRAPTPEQRLGEDWQAYMRRFNRYKQRIKSDREATCGQYQRLQGQISRIDMEIARLREEILQLNSR